MAYFIVPTYSDLSLYEQVVLLNLCRYANNNTKKCWPSQATLAKKCDTTIKKVREGIRGLEKKGYITTKLTNRTMVYTITILLTGRVENVLPEEQENICSVESDLPGKVESDRQTILSELEKNLRTKNEKRTKQPTEQDKPKSKTPSLTVQVENELVKEYKKLEELGTKVVQPSIAIQRTLIKNSLTFFDNDLDWIKAYIKRALQDKYVVSQCYSSTALFGRITIQKYLRDTKPVKYSDPAPVYELSETDKMVAAMTPDERKKWIREEMRRARERRAMK